MAHFAKLDDNNVVLEVNAVNNAELIVEKTTITEDGYVNVTITESEEKGIAFLTQWSGGHSNWRQTSYNGNFRGKYAGIGDTYDAVNNVFVPPVVDTTPVVDTSQIIPSLTTADIQSLTTTGL